MEFFLSSDIHQGDELFSVQSRGKQCAFMSLSAILTAQNIPLIDWSKTTFNNVFNIARRYNALKSFRSWLNCTRPTYRIFVYR